MFTNRSRRRIPQVELCESKLLLSAAALELPVIYTPQAMARLDAIPPGPTATDAVASEDSGEQEHTEATSSKTKWLFGCSSGAHSRDSGPTFTAKRLLTDSAPKATHSADHSHVDPWYVKVGDTHPVGPTFTASGRAVKFDPVAQSGDVVPTARNNGIFGSGDPTPVSSSTSDPRPVFTSSAIFSRGIFVDGSDPKPVATSEIMLGSDGDPTQPRPVTTGDPTPLGPTAIFMGDPSHSRPVETHSLGDVNPKFTATGLF